MVASNIFFFTSSCIPFGSSHGPQGSLTGFFFFFPLCSGTSDPIPNILRLRAIVLALVPTKSLPSLKGARLGQRARDKFSIKIKINLETHLTAS